LRGTELPDQVADIINPRGRVPGIHNSGIYGAGVGGLGEGPVPNNMPAILLE